MQPIAWPASHCLTDIYYNPCNNSRTFPPERFSQTADEVDSVSDLAQRFFHRQGCIDELGSYTLFVTLRWVTTIG